MIRQPNSQTQAARQLVILSRPQNVVFSGVLSFATARIAGASWLVAGLCYVGIFCLYALAASYNNLQDIETDRLNHRKDNPLATGSLNTSIVRLYMWFMAVTVTLLQLGLKQPTSIIYMGLYALLLVAYSSPHIKLQARGILASIVLSVCYGTLPLFLGWTQQRTPNLQFYVLAALLIMLMLPSLLAKDYKDLVGDRKTGKNTLLVRHGPTVVMRVSALILILAFITSVLAYFQFNWPPVIILLVVVYSLCVSILHHKRGKTGGYFLRLPQLLVLIISWLILQHIAH